jgi:hypothetical protein
MLARTKFIAKRKLRRNKKEQTAIRAAKKKEAAKRKTIKEAAKAAKQTNRKAKKNNHTSSTPIQQTDQGYESVGEIQPNIKEIERGIEAQITTELHAAVADSGLTRPYTS